MVVSVDGGGGVANLIGFIQKRRANSVEIDGLKGFHILSHLHYSLSIFLSNNLTTINLNSDNRIVIGGSRPRVPCATWQGHGQGKGKGDVRAVTQLLIGLSSEINMSFLFGKRKTPAELLRENKRMLDKSIREIERERQGLQTQEKKLIAEIKKSAKQGQMGAVRIMAKDLIRTRHQIEKFYKLKSQLQGTLKSTQAMGEAMKGVTKAMGQMNKQMNLPSLQKIMQEFERQNERMELTSEVMGDAMDDALEGDEEEDETDELVNQVLDEIGIDVNQEVFILFFDNFLSNEIISSLN
ncbi:Vacuolar protein sorting-associated protein 2-like protein 1 [Bienertia sinuspersici]